MWCDVLGFLDAMIFCNNFARWLQKIVATWCVQPSATRPLFGTNLHFRQFQEMTNHECRMKLLSKCLKWRFVPKRGRVAEGWMCWVFWDAMIFCNNFARWLQKIVATWCVWFFGMCWVFWDAMIFCNNFARWLQKIAAVCDVLVFWDATILCNNFTRWLQKVVATCDVFGFLGCYYPL